MSEKSDREKEENEQDEQKQKSQAKGLTNSSDGKPDLKKRTTFADVDGIKPNASKTPTAQSRVIFPESVKDLEDTIKQNQNKLVVIYFFAVWCGSCKMMTPRVDDLSRQFANQAVFIKLDSEIFEAASEQYEVSVLPFFVFLRGGKKIDTFIGSNPDKLKEVIAKLTQPPAD